MAEIAGSRHVAPIVCAYCGEVVAPRQRHLADDDDAAQTLHPWCRITMRDQLAMSEAERWHAENLDEHLHRIALTCASRF